MNYVLIEEADRKDKVRFYAIISLIVAIVLSLSVACWWLATTRISAVSGADPTFVIDTHAGNNFAAPLTHDIASEASGGGIKIPGYSEISLIEGVADARIVMPNPEGNRCYFKFQLVLEEGDEVLYMSDWVPPGKTISEETLSRGLSAGTYDAIVRITTASLDESHTPMNGSDVKTKLVVSKN